MTRMSNQKHFLRSNDEINTIYISVNIYGVPFSSNTKGCLLNKPVCNWYFCLMWKIIRTITNDRK